jgi:hypothetical protein
MAFPVTLLEGNVPKGKVDLVKGFLFCCREASSSEASSVSLLELPDSNTPYMLTLALNAIS